MAKEIEDLSWMDNAEKVLRDAVSKGNQRLTGPSSKMLLKEMVYSMIDAIVGILTFKDPSGGAEFFFNEMQNACTMFVGIYEKLMYDDVVTKDAFEFADMTQKMKESVMRDKVEKLKRCSVFINDAHFEIALSLMNSIQRKLKSVKKSHDGESKFECFTGASAEEMCSRIMDAYCHMVSGCAKARCYQQLADWIRCQNESGDYNDIVKEMEDELHDK